MLLGRRSHEDVRSFLCGYCDVALAPYNHEWKQSTVPGFFGSRKLREYLAAGLPVLAPDIPAMDPVVLASSAGALYRPGSAEDLAETLEAWMADPDLVKRMGARGREAARAFSWDALVEDSELMRCIARWDAV